MRSSIGRNVCNVVLVLASAVALSTGLSHEARATPGSAGWQGRFVFNVPTGQTDQFFHLACPASFPVAMSGGFLPNAAAKIGMVVTGNGPRLDLNPTSFNEWSWIFDWPDGGARPGSRITFDVYCVAGPP